MHRLNKIESPVRFDDPIPEHPSSSPTKNRSKHNQKALVDRGVGSQCGSACKYNEERRILALSDNSLVHMISPNGVNVKNPAYLEY